MKKIVLTLFLICNVLVVSAQFNAGLKAGVNVSQLHLSGDGDSETTDMAVGFQFGGYAIFNLSDALSVQPELIYNRVGGKESAYDDDLGGDFTETYKVDYISLPVIFKYKVGQNFNLQAGPQVGILVSAKGKLEASGQSIEVDVKDMFKTTDFGINVGLGFTKDRIGIDARYLFGIANIADDSGNLKVTDRVIQFAISYRLTNND